MFAGKCFLFLQWIRTSLCLVGQLAQLQPCGTSGRRQTFLPAEIGSRPKIITTWSRTPRCCGKLSHAASTVLWTKKQNRWLVGKPHNPLGCNWNILIFNCFAVVPDFFWVPFSGIFNLRCRIQKQVVEEQWIWNALFLEAQSRFEYAFGTNLNGEGKKGLCGCHTSLQMKICHL